MEIIQNKVIKKITTIMILIVMLIGIASPVFAAHTNEINVGDTLQIKSGLEWNTYETKDAAKKTNNPSGKLKNNEKVTVVAKYTGDYANVLKIEENRFIYYGPQAKDSFTTTKGTTKTATKVDTSAQEELPVITETKVETPSGSGLLEGGGAIIGGIFDIATSEKTWNLLKYIGDIIVNTIRWIMETLGGLGDFSLDFPKTELPKKEEIHKNEEVIITTVKTNAEEPKEEKKEEVSENTIKYTFKGGETVEVSKEIESAIGELTYEDYKNLVIVAHHEGGGAGNDYTQAIYIAATLINIAQNNKTSITQTKKDCCDDWAISPWGSYEDTSKSTNVVKAVQEALLGKDPTSDINDGKGALSWSSRQENWLKKGEVRAMYDSKGVLRAYAVGTNYNSVQYFKDVYNRNLDSLDAK